MNYTYSIAMETIGLTGHTSINYIEKFIPRTEENKKRIEGMNVIRSFDDPFNPCNTVFVVR